MYHRILPHSERIKDQSPNKDQLVVSLERFEEQISVISNNYKAISMDNLFGPLDNPNSEFGVAVTFDDGYKDNLTHALPVLKKYDVPATIYITTRFPEGDGNVWWIELAEICYSRDHVVFDWEGRTHRIDLKTASLKRRAFNRLKKMVKSSIPDENRRLMTAIRGNESAADYSGLFLTWDDIRQLDQESLVTIGAHTHSHFNLQEMDIPSAVSDIEKGRILLEEKVGHPVSHFAFPYGYYDPAALESYGLNHYFKTVVSTNPGSFDYHSNMYCLPRFQMKEEHDGNRIKTRLSGWESFIRSLLKSNNLQR